MTFSSRYINCSHVKRCKHNSSNPLMTPQYPRIVNEIPELRTLSEKIEITFIKNKDPDIKITLSDNINQCIQFIIPKDYPFKAPLLSINNTPFLQTLPHIEVSKYRSQIRKPMPFIGNCLHCDFILKDSWSPVLGMKQVLQEITKVQTTHRIIQEYILLQAISNQNEIPKEIIEIIHDYLHP